MSPLSWVALVGCAFTFFAGCGAPDRRNGAIYFLASAAYLVAAVLE